MIQDDHARYRMASHNFVVPRFERFILTFGSCPDCLVLDDEFSVLPISREKNIIPIEPPPQKKREKERSTDTQLKDLNDSLSDTKPAGDLVKLAKTIDQAQLVLIVIEAIAEKTVFGRDSDCLPWKR